MNFLHLFIRKRRFVPDVGVQGQRKSGQPCLVLVRPDRKTTDRVFTKFRTKSGQRTESRQTESGQRIWIVSGQRTESRQEKSRQKRDTDRTRTVLPTDACFVHVSNSIQFRQRLTHFLKTRHFQNSKIFSENPYFLVKNIFIGSILY